MLAKKSRRISFLSCTNRVMKYSNNNTHDYWTHLPVVGLLNGCAGESVTGA